MKILAEKVIAELKKYVSAQRKKTNEWFFKTGKGEYGYGDVFIGVTVPDTRRVAKIFFKEISFFELAKLLKNKIHEVRLVALEILVYKYEKLDCKKDCVDFYLKNLKYVNNWDLVDGSASYILGNYMRLHEKGNINKLLQLARSKDLWEKRVAIVACYDFIKNKSSVELMQIAELVKNDSHDLLQKALGWMLREVYKNVDEKIVRTFLAKNIRTLPRTTLRYAIEKMDIFERKKWLKM
jgi:3-methyladenine DNA glycosylase AlkD